MSARKRSVCLFSLYFCGENTNLLDMKKKVLLIVIALGAIYGASRYLGTETVSELAFQNVEALAQGEGGFPENFYCINAGDIDCYGHKVEDKYTGFGLDPERETE
jgi:hypothetical protein